MAWDVVSRTNARIQGTMLRVGRNLPVTILIAAFAASGAAAQQSRRPQRPSTSLSNALGTLGILPDSVRSILLLYSGKSLSRSRANEVEADVLKKPDGIDNRLTLIGYYSANGQTPTDRLRLRDHVLWVVENHPEHPATAEPSLRDLPDDREGNGRILALWNANLQSGGDDLDVLKNAEKFFFGKDPAEAARLIHRIAEREPESRQWPDELAQLYRIFGIPGEYFADPGERALEAYQRVLRLTRNRTARETLAGEMAAAAFKIGDFAGAAQLAKIHLQSSDRNAVQRANTLLGRVALRAGDLAGGKQRLLDSAKPEAARDVSISGPTMVLAKELLEKGERDIVIQYLENCMPLWPRGETFLQNWIADIQAGKTPNFGSLAF